MCYKKIKSVEKQQILIQQELSYCQQIARQLRTQYAEGIYRLKYYIVTLKSGLEITQAHSNWYHSKASVQVVEHLASVRR